MQAFLKLLNIAALVALIASQCNAAPTKYHAEAIDVSGHHYEDRSLYAKGDINARVNHITPPSGNKFKPPVESPSERGDLSVRVNHVTPPSGNKFVPPVESPSKRGGQLTTQSKTADGQDVAFNFNRAIPEGFDTGAEHLKGKAAQVKDEEVIARGGGDPISYGALGRNRVPQDPKHKNNSKPGGGQPTNPYTSGCSPIAHCRGKGH